MFMACLSGCQIVKSGHIFFQFENTALMTASFYDRVECATLLLEHGAQLELRNEVRLSLQIIIVLSQLHVHVYF